MGFFDNFFKKKKEIKETVEKALEEANPNEKKPDDNCEVNKSAETSEINHDIKSVDDGVPKSVRVAAKQYLPGDVLSIQSVLPMVKELVANLGIDNSISNEVKEMVDKCKKGETAVLDCLIFAANKTNTLLENSNVDPALEKVKNGDEDTLLKTWVVLDFFVSVLKTDSSEFLKKARDFLTENIDGDKLVEQEALEYGEFVKLEKECREVQEQKQSDEESKNKLLMFFEKLLSRKALYVLYDVDYVDLFPYISYDGKIEVCTRFEIAVKLKRHYEEISYGHTYVKRIEQKDFEKVFKAICHLGIGIARIDNGLFPVDVSLSERFSTMKMNLIERFNGGMRSLFLRCKQYEKRFNNSLKLVKDTPKEKTMLESVLTMRFNGYRELGNSLVYVLIPKKYDKENTLYTPKALTKAMMLCNAAKLSETSLIAPGNHGYSVYDGKINVRVAFHGEEEAVENSKVCVFTSMLEAEKTRRNFAEKGCNDSILTITFEELEAHIGECAGILIDPMSYCYEIKKAEYPQIKKWRGVKGRIVVNLKKKEDTQSDEQPNLNDNTEKEDE